MKRIACMFFAVSLLACACGGDDDFEGCATDEMQCNGDVIEKCDSGSFWMPVLNGDCSDLGLSCYNDREHCTGITPMPCCDL